MVTYVEQARAAFRGGHTELLEALSRAEIVRARAAGDVPGELAAVCMLARACIRRHDFAAAEQLARRGRRLAESRPDRNLLQTPLHIQAAVARMSGDLTSARALYRESIQLNESIGEPRMAIMERHNLGYVELHLGDVAAAHDLFTAARTQALRLGYTDQLAEMALGAAVVSCAGGDPERAASLLGASDKDYDNHGRIPDPDDAAERRRLVNAIRRVMSREAFDAAYAMGATVSLPKALRDWPR
ncbi:tetratricopeptide repeat protein [Paractinoplanes toevensis]|uniref:MalT-like TPR region domain-containing protein n=1 Tax=Paractinoplanes toevensis TaxID=571911 RepID=A0A919TFW9_9ACTN|nr:tetratricopeptide repeat protein [Actinoplanes toevensis]GIM94800.1 hypothetical protein Ato02nite_065930 [Actinoplanes toevensis]